MSLYDQIATLDPDVRSRLTTIADDLAWVAAMRTSGTLDARGACDLVVALLDDAGVTGEARSLTLALFGGAQ